MIPFLRVHRSPASQPAAPVHTRPLDSAVVDPVRTTPLAPAPDRADRALISAPTWEPIAAPSTARCQAASTAAASETPGEDAAGVERRFGCAMASEPNTLPPIRPATSQTMDFTTMLHPLHVTTSLACRNPADGGLAGLHSARCRGKPPSEDGCP